MKRRGFLSALLTFFGSATLVSFAYPLVRFLSPPSKAEKTKTLAVSKVKIPPGKAKEVVFNDTPTIIIHRPNKGFIALSRVCTHLGCLIVYDEASGRLFCPCHAALFTDEGNVIAGPAPKPLTKFPITVQGKHIIIG